MTTEPEATASRPKDRKLQILQTLAELLQTPKGEKITTALLARRLDVSEAALYRHFSSKAQMYEGLIEFIESSLFSVINRIGGEEAAGLKQTEQTLALLLGFARKNRGLTRVLIGDALVHENERLQARINQLLDRVEAALRQSLRIALSNGELPAALDAGRAANFGLCYVIGRWQGFVKSGFARDPLADWPQHWPMLLNGWLAAGEPASTPTA